MAVTASCLGCQRHDSLAVRGLHPSSGSRGLPAGIPVSRASAPSPGACVAGHAAASLPAAPACVAAGRWERAATSDEPDLASPAETLAPAVPADACRLPAAGEPSSSGCRPPRLSYLTGRRTATPRPAGATASALAMTAFPSPAASDRRRACSCHRASTIASASVTRFFLPVPRLGSPMSATETFSASISSLYSRHRSSMSESVYFP